MNKHLHQVNRRVSGRIVYTAWFEGETCPSDCPGAVEEKNVPGMHLPEEGVFGGTPSDPHP